MRHVRVMYRILLLCCMLVVQLQAWRTLHPHRVASLQHHVIMPSTALHAKEPSEVSDRDLSLTHTTKSAGLRQICGLLSLVALPTAAYAQRGAFEMDMDFYLQNMLGTRGKVVSSTKGQLTIYPSSRKLDSTTSKDILEIVLRQLSLATGTPSAVLLQDVSQQMPDSLRYFKTFLPISTEDITDKYYFDILLYLLYLRVGEVVSKSEDRVKLRDSVGQALLEYFDKKCSLQIASRNKTTNEVANVMQLLLWKYKEAGLLADYEFNDEDLRDEDYVQTTFSQDLSLDIQVTTKAPVALIAFMQQSKQNTFYHPDLIGNTITALIRNMGFKARCEDYLMDNYYREENFDLQAQDILYEFIIAKA